MSGGSMATLAGIAALRAKVKGDPQAIRDHAAALRVAAGHVASATGKLPSAVKAVNAAWEGASADAFSGYMSAYPKAGTGLKEALNACADALDRAAGTLEDAHSKIGTLYDDAVSRSNTYKRQYLLQNPGTTESDAETALAATTIVSGNLTRAQEIVDKADSVLGEVKKALDGQVGSDKEFGYFSAIRVAGGADFEPGTKQVEWVRTSSTERTALQAAATDESGVTMGVSGSGSVAGGGGGGGYAYAGGTSSAGSVPLPRADIVAYIKEAIRVIKSPEMASAIEAKQRGLLNKLKDLDPDDPRDIQRIWTIIYHESGGNPSAINNWDINARNGIPSQGLMQTIPPTFQSNALPGHGKILEPVDNIIAGVLYTYRRYGSLAGHPGISSLESGGGYRPY
ncbi:WXG100 family type VII secretion target [Nonomuraea roseoviolacea]|uniref:WXG100 family type VII secretion target n=1 Tax=Nonomuraea roseoviolacea subsp. carminata TaxID=160689 RepID=A0ABT1JW25_9ACTN|nr:WXG100 family type VII secretion target [Nonomuraea roseoviolacea]MCP2345959.1 WXG100 family type VII secretion target [Nonomuraea roseoviolacea subsp. carminata]